MISRPSAPNPAANCPVTHCLKVVGGKWKPVILFCLSHGVNRFGAMRRAIPTITKHMLTQQLRDLEADGIIERTVYAEVPPRVDYTLTERGASLRSVISAMRRWGEKDMALGHTQR